MRYLPFPLRHRYAFARAIQVIQRGHIQKSIIAIQVNALQNTCHPCQPAFGYRDIPSTQPSTTDSHFPTIGSLSSN